MTTAKLDGKILLGSGSVSWALRTGTAPVLSTFHMVPEDAQSIAKKSAKAGKAVPITLEINDGGKKITVKKLYFLHEAPGPNPNVSAVTVADRRWLWSFCHVGPRKYNWRRRTGVKRVVDPDKPAADLADQVPDDIWYANWSLKNPKDDSGKSDVWSAKDVLENVLRKVLSFEEEYNGEGASFEFDDSFNKNIPIENLSIDDPGDAAINRVLGFVPGAEVYVDLEGKIRVMSKASGKEGTMKGGGLTGMVANLGPEKVGQGHIAMIANAIMRPKKIHCLFTREVEVRFDFEEGTNFEPSTTTESRPVPSNTSSRGLYNVLQVPDWNLPNTTVPQGTWVTFDRALAAWDSVRDTQPKGMDLKIDYPIIRRAFVPFMDLWSSLRLLGDYHPNNDWASRIGAIQSHYRRTFMISQQWLNKIQSMRADRVSIIDTENGVRAPAAVWANYSRMGSMKSMRRNLLENAQESPVYAMNVVAYPQRAAEGSSDGVENPLCVQFPVKKSADGAFLSQPSGTLSIMDPDQGIMQINFHPDIYRTYEMMLPSWIELSDADENKDFSEDGERPANAGPVSNPTDFNKPITFDMVCGGSEAAFVNKSPKLSANHRVAVILTAIPASWYSESKPDGEQKPAEKNQQLEVVTIEAKDSDLKDMVADPVKQSLSKALGPDMYVRIGAGVAVARVQWLDDKYQEIERVFGMGDGKEPDLSGMVVNRDQGDGEETTGGANLNAVAMGAAARIYSSLVDRFQGAMTTGLEPSATPAGWLEEVVHSISSNGDVSTRLDFPESVEQLDLLSYLDSSTRETIMKLARPGA